MGGDLGKIANVPNLRNNLVKYGVRKERASSALSTLSKMSKKSNRSLSASS